MSPQFSAIYFIFRGLLLSLIVILGLAWVSMKVAQKMRLIDLPGSAPHKSHTRPTPLAGGIALFFSLLICETLLRTLIEPTIRATFLAGAVVFVFGLLDDYWTLPPLAKLLGQILAAVILIFSGVYVRIFESPEFFFYGDTRLYLYLDWLLTIFWVVGITNAFNFVDSMDGLAVGLGGMAVAFFVLLTLDSQQFLLSQHSALIFGACLGLYFYNSPPALLFLGDSGSQTLGFILSVLAIAYNPQGAYQSSSWFVPVIMLGVPTVDRDLALETPTSYLCCGAGSHLSSSAAPVSIAQSRRTGDADQLFDVRLPGDFGFEPAAVDRQRHLFVCADDGHRGIDLLGRGQGLGIIEKLSYGMVISR